MEKYTQYRDKATGISPFLPVVQTNVIGVSDSPLRSFLKTSKLELIPKILIVVIKSLLILPLLFIYLVVSPILGSHNVVVLLRAILFVAGLTSYELSIQNLKTKSINNRSFYPSKNDVYFVNFSSPLDHLLLLLISNDESVILMPNKNGDLQQLSQLAFISKSICGYVPENEAPFAKLDYKTLKNKIIYIFAEGTTSNGKSILPFLSTQTKFDEFLKKLSNDGKTHKIRSIGIKIYPSTLVTPLKYGYLAYLFKLLTTLSFNAKLRINIANELNLFDSSLSKIRTSFTNNGKFKLVNEDLNAKAKSRFIQSYTGRR